MPKRRTMPDASDDEDSAYAASAAGSESDVYESETNTSRSRRAKPSAVRGRRGRSKVTAAPARAAVASASDAVAIPHSATRHTFSSDDAEATAISLLAWYAGVHAARGMPWRKPFNPAWTPEERGQRAYEVWISEIMLQQTQVATVIPYYNRWMEKFPTLKALAGGSIDEVHALWKGLGYYSRASRLLEGAQKVMKTPKLQGRLPTNAEAMQADVPGVGRYSAGAICSIAYGEQVPVLDGNVHRLLSRVLALHAPPKSKSTLDLLWGGATALVRTSAASAAPGDLNQGLIELGSTVCKPKGPACGTCPLRRHCRAYALQSAGARPSVLDLMKAASNRSSSDSTTAQVTDNNIPDIEELCGLCVPIADALTVEAFPMRAEKKKPREETDTVRVIEWRSGSTASQRWFLLVKRPEGGLLGGLEEFPTEPDEDGSSHLTESESAHHAVQRLLQGEVAPLVSSPGMKGRAEGTGPQDSESRPGSLRITEIKEAGDVLHIFSHIRKTYRVRWVTLEGGGAQPPSLRPQPMPAGASKKSAKKVKMASKTTTRVVKKRRVKAAESIEVIDADDVQDEQAVTETSAIQLRWVPLDKVSDANIGTGVVKIWDRVRALW